MALATRPRPKSHTKKRQARHHRHSKVYLKTYWPYLPILGIVALGYEANRHWPAGLVSLDSGSANLSRAEALGGSQNQSMFLLILAIAAVAGGVFIVSHWYRVHRLLNRGEMFVAKHPWLDVGLVLIATAGVVLTRSNL